MAIGVITVLLFLLTRPVVVVGAAAVANDTAINSTTIVVRPCSYFNFDCHGCVDLGCYYCPLTGLCDASTATTRDARFLENSCQVPKDYISSSSSLASSSSSSSSSCDDIPAIKSFFFSDPLVSINRWALDMIDVESVWRDKGYFGLGVHVRVNDNTLDHPQHDEFGDGGDRIDWDNSCDGILRDVLDDETADEEDEEDDTHDSNTTMPQSGTGGNYSHGMMVASLIGAEGDNDKCSVGVAPNVTFSFCTAHGEVHDFISNRMDTVDISHNSWAQPACEGHTDRRRMLHYRRKLRGYQKGKMEHDNIVGHRGDNKKDMDLFVCPFSYQPQQFVDRYNLTFPCDSCPELLLGFGRRNVQPEQAGRDSDGRDHKGPDALGGEDGRETFFTLNEDCSKAIKDHCYFYFDQDSEACIDYIDVLLEDGGCKFGNTLTDELREALTEGITKGRDGKGIIYIFSSGNAFLSGDDAGLQPYAQNTRFTITVGAVAYGGQRAWYSTPSAKVFISAPGGDYRARETQMAGAGMHGTCQDSGSGTSFSAPLVSGVVALMLEANPDLTWRDVQAILASTSKRPTVEASPTSTITTESTFVDETEAINGGGYWHSHYYGFGIINAAQAVDAAETWENLGPEEMIVAETGLLNFTIPDDPTKPLITNLTVPAIDGEDGTNHGAFVIETVYLYVALDHSSRGHLKINLTSPQGMASVVSPGNRPESGQEEVWQFTTVRSWGESPVGNWTLSITDTRPGDVVDCFDDEWMYGSINCRALEAMKYCENGLFDPYGYAAEDSKYDSIFGHVDGGKLAIEACCECGGGTNSDEWPETLLSWKIVVHGHGPILPSSSSDNTTSPVSGKNDTAEADTEEGIECQSIGKEGRLIRQRLFSYIRLLYASVY